MRNAGRVPWLVALAGLCLAAAGCDLFEPPDPRKPGPIRVDPRPAATDVDLGLAIYPPAKPPGRRAEYRFVAPSLKPKTYRAAYALTDAENRSIKKALADYATSVGYHRIDKGRFKWEPPEGCSKDMRCALEVIARRNQADVEPIAERFRKRARDAKLSQLQIAQLVVNFVQHIPYQIPRDSPFGLLPPAIVVHERRGDCDSKALLALLLLRSLGIESVIVSSNTHKHAMLGIALPTQGTTIEHEGKRYAMTECTAPGWPIGRMHPKLKSPSDWRVIPVRSKGRFSTKTPSDEARPKKKRRGEPR
jgi:transglutaminase-like putative cysteine protease